MSANRSARVQECAYIYPDGRTCRRIPKRGEKLCLGHKAHRQRRPGEEDEAFEKQMTGWVQQLDAMPLEELLHAAQDSLAGIAGLIDRKASRAHRVAFTRAGIAVSAAVNQLEETMAGYRAHAARPESQPAPNHAVIANAPPTPAEDPGAASTAEEKLQALDRIEALCAKLLSTPSSYA